ncbi:hypothetical protein CARUB_v10021731mg [Capsella rubella]|uniref:Protein kinase domain-containing protein n=1 Tax=Capsella rubella TaxID=81985 RepID=R0I7Z0_9BRAS|nr:probable inactive receptor-like protein kinase At1g65250 [Capsella rubella]EOA34220.1 hypothetical protein CARUB_v10021731mg [Capsella rubella]
MSWLRKTKNKKPTKSEIVANERGAKLLEELIECCNGKSNPIKFFSAEEILKATNSFRDSNRIIGLSGGNNYWTEWYSGKNENHSKIRVKKIYRYGDEKIICRDIAVSSMVSGHKNFMKLVGCCLEFKDPVIVYDDVKKHSKLDLSSQSWKRRMKTAEDIAIAVAYLHTAFPMPFVHRCMSLLNIFVDEDGTAKLTDFSYCVSIPQGETSVQVDDTPMLGFYGYVEYDHRKSGVVSEKTDVFAFGFFMQSLLIGRERSWEIWEKVNENGYNERNVDDESHQFWLSKFGVEEKRMDHEFADQEMIEKMGEISEEELFQMKAFLMLSLRCVGHKGEIPTMVEVAKELKKIQRSLNTA